MSIVVSLLPRPPGQTSLVVDLARIVGAGAVSTQEGDRLAYARDAWPRDLLRVRAGEIPCAPACVVWPESALEVVRVLELAERLAIPVVPYGAGSGVAGGARPSDGGIVLDLKRMRAIRALDERSLRAEVEAGIIGLRLEQALNVRGLTLGHFPSSIGCSTLGGWLAARSAGQMSTLYGKIEDMTLGLEVVAKGRIRRLELGPHPSEGIDFNGLLLGSEGTLGVITAAALRLRPLPARRTFRGYRFPTVEAGIQAVRQIMRLNVRPSVVRLYDALDTLVGRSRGRDDEESLEARSVEGLARAAQIVASEVAERIPRATAGRLKSALVGATVRAVFGSPLLLNRALEVLREECLLVLGFEGQAALVALESAHAHEVCVAAGAKDLGAELGEQWYRHRYDVSFKQSKLYAAGLFVDTMEVAATWDRLVPLYRGIRRAIARDAFVMAHFSHAYREGCSIYFTFAGPSSSPRHLDETLLRYDRIWRNALSAVHEAGGTISHHHGIGELKGKNVARELGPGGLRLLTALKETLDPGHLLNPGKLGLAGGKTPSQRPRPTSTGRPSRESVSVRDAGFPKEIAMALGEGNVAVSGTRVVLRPPDESGVAAVLRVACARSVPITTDQTGFRAPPGAAHIDLSRLEGVSRVSDHSLIAEVEAGVKVGRLEDLLNEHGLTLGRLHPRALNRTVGAAIARGLLIRRATYFGDLGDVCLAVRGFLANGSTVETRAVPRSATGPALERALIGGQGRLGIITRATLRIAPSNVVRREVAYRFPTLEQGIEATRTLLQRGVRPASGRVLVQDTDAILTVEFAAVSEELLDAGAAILASAAANGEGARAEGAFDPRGGRFDAVVECAVPWSIAAPVARGMKSVAQGEIWLDFFTPEEVTVVARVLSRENRRQTLAAGLGAGSGARVVSGADPLELAVDVSGERAGLVEGREPRSLHIEEAGHIAGRRDAGANDYDDVRDELAARLDPAGILRGRI